MRTRPLTMNAALGLALIALVALAAAVALADPDPGRTPREPASPAQPPAHADAPPPVAINQAEITQGVPDDPDAARQARADQAAKMAADPRATVVPPMIAEIRATLDAARAAVAELQARLPGTADPQARHDLQQRIAARKQQAELDILGIQAREARARDDQALAAELEAAIEALLAPPAPTPPATPRPAPAGQR